MDNKTYPKARDTGLVVQEMPDEVLIYDLDTNKAHCLNDSAATVWRACDGTNSIADIIEQFERAQGGKVAEDFVWLAIDQLNENGLLQPGTTSRFANQSRRDVLKKIGFASVVAIPIIASLVAPRNALAVTSCSCVPSGTNPSSECQTNSSSCPAGDYCNCNSVCQSTPQTCP